MPSAIVPSGAAVIKVMATGDAMTSGLSSEALGAVQFTGEELRAAADEGTGRGCRSPRMRTDRMASSPPSRPGSTGWNTPRF
jgi:hypothetical protein